jgi:hypothetical protein
VESYARRVDGRLLAIGVLRALAAEFGEFGPRDARARRFTRGVASV